MSHMNDDGVMLDSGDIFTSETRPDGKEHIHAWTLEEGEVVELYTDGKVYSLETLGDCLCGQAAPGDYDYAFLCLRGGGDLGEISQFIHMNLAALDRHAEIGGDRQQ